MWSGSTAWILVRLELDDGKSRAVQNSKIPIYPYSNTGRMFRRDRSSTQEQPSPDATPCYYGRRQHDMASQAPPPPMNPWELQALNQSNPSLIGTGSENAMRSNPLFTPSLYCPSGYDLMSILLHVRSRPNPLIDLGAIDCSVSLTLCDLEQPDMPILYASDAFYELTGYSEREVLGRNCRFLQTPYRVKDGADKAVAQQMGSAIRNNQEIQIELWNWKRDGSRFRNILSIIPIVMEGHRYAVGLQCEV